MHLAALDEPLRDEPDAARTIEVERDVAAARPQVADQRRLLADVVEVVDLERHAGLARERQQVQHDVGRTARGRGAGDAVLDRLARQDLARPQPAPQHVHHQLPGLEADAVLARVGRADGAAAHRRDAEELEHHRHRVGGVLRAAGARAGAGGLLDRGQLLVADGAGGVLTDALEDVLDRDVPPVQHAGVDRAAVEREAGDVEAREGERRRGDRLVAADEDDRRVEAVADAAELDRVGNQLAADQRGLHALRAHRDAVADRDGVDLHRRAARGAHAGHDVLRQLALAEVAGHRADPAVRHHHERALQVLAGEPDGLEVRARRRAVRSIDDRAAAVPGIERHLPPPWIALPRMKPPGRGC